MEIVHCPPLPLFFSSTIPASCRLRDEAGPRWVARAGEVVVKGLFLSNCCRVRGETPAFERAVLAVGQSLYLWRLSVCCVVSIRVCASPPPKRARTGPAAFPSGLLLAPFNVSHAPRGIAAMLVPNFPNIGVASLGAAGKARVGGGRGVAMPRPLLNCVHGWLFLCRLGLARALAGDFVVAFGNPHFSSP